MKKTLLMLLLLGGVNIQAQDFRGYDWGTEKRVIQQAEPELIGHDQILYQDNFSLDGHKASYSYAFLNNELQAGIYVAKALTSSGKVLTFKAWLQALTDKYGEPDDIIADIPTNVTNMDPMAYITLFSDGDMICLWLLASGTVIELRTFETDYSRTTMVRYLSPAYGKYLLEKADKDW